MADEVLAGWTKEAREPAEKVMQKYGVPCVPGSDGPLGNDEGEILKAHADAAPEAEHEEPYVLHVEPGKSRSLVWRFTRVDLLGYGCLIHGSGQTAMTGRILVRR